MNLNCFIISVALLAAGLTAGCATEHDIESDHKKDFTERLVLETRTGQYKEKPGDTEWTETTSRIVSASCRPEVPALTAWGGRKDLTATDIEGTDGYFRLGRVGRRWVFVDPEGGVNIIRGTQNVAYPESSRFASADDWAAETAELLLAYGFNHADFTGVRPQYQLNARNERILNPAEGRKNSHSVALNMLRSFMWDDARNLPWTYDDTDRDMNRLNLIFEERYETYLDEKTREICAQVADDPYMLGYQLDNELGFRGWDYRYGNQDVLLHKFLALPDAATVKVRFSAQAYSEKYDGSGADAGKILVKAVRGAVLGAKGAITGTVTEVSAADPVDISAAKARFREFEATLTNVTPDCRIVISTSEKRALLDNVVVTCTAITPATKPAAPGGVSFDAAAAADRLTLKWNAVPDATSYTVAYWKGSASAPESEYAYKTGIASTATSQELTNLESNTSYWAKVKAVGSLDSDWSETANATTMDSGGEPLLPTADLLDVVFRNDGSAMDNSSSATPVRRMPSSRP